MQSGIPCAMVLTVSFVLSLVSRAFMPPSPADHPANLMPASGHQDHTASPSANALSSVARPASIASRLTFRDDSAYAPLAEAGQRESIKLFLPNCEAEYFSPMGWTGAEMLEAQTLICPSGKSVHPLVMAGLDPAIHVFPSKIVGWAKRSVPTIQMEFA